MGNPESPDNFSLKIHQLKINLKSRTIPEWILFFVIIPLLLLLFYAFPQEIKNSYFILSTANPGSLANLAPEWVYTFPAVSPSRE